MQTFSTRSVARILAVSPDRIRYWVKRRLVKPARIHGRNYEFGFNDLLVMRLTKELLPTRRRLQPIRRCFERLGTLLNPEKPVTALKLYNEDGRMVVRDGELKLEVETGQLILDFDVAGFRQDVEKKTGAKVRSLFERDSRADDANPARAIEFYRNLLDREPGNFDAHVALGGLLQRQGRLSDALGHYLAAAVLKPDSADLHLHLGILHRKRDQPDAAVRSFQRALQGEPDLIEAHRHLAELYEQIGRKRDAFRHLSAVHRLTRGQ